MSRQDPLVLAPGDSQNFGLLFDVKSLGLQGGTIQVLSDDPKTPIFNIPVMGTGLTGSDILSRQKMVKLGNDFILLKVFFAASPNEVPAVLRTQSDADGNFEFNVTPGQTYTLTIFDPDSGLIGSTGLRQAGVLGIFGGRITQDDLKVVFGASAAPDADQNGTPDDIDLVLGTGALQQSGLGSSNPVIGSFVPPSVRMQWELHGGS